MRRFKHCIIRVMLLSSTRLCLIASVSLVQEYLNGRMVTASEIAATYNFNARSINPSLTRLVRVGLLRSQVGGKGRGFVLARDPREISLFDIVNSLEGSSELVRCRDMMYGVKCAIGDCENCHVYIRLNSLYASENEILKGVSLFDHYLKSLPDAEAVRKAEDMIAGRDVVASEA